MCSVAYPSEQWVILLNYCYVYSFKMFFALDDNLRGSKSFINKLIFLFPPLVPEACPDYNDSARKLNSSLAKNRFASLSWSCEGCDIKFSFFPRHTFLWFLKKIGSSVNTKRAYLLKWAWAEHRDGRQIGVTRPPHNFVAACSDDASHKSYLA